ncbi:MAG: epoxyqueuosine reductase [Deltaproteobacteria bacterium]|nr:epoxyqueuosine reductase [Deltaproteobacteria bacterium]
MSATDTIQREIERFVRESASNRHEDGSGPYFDEPLVGFASADDPLFVEYKRIIGSFHLTPRELFEGAFGPGTLHDGTVVVWILPIPEETRLSNRAQDRLPSKRWAHTRAFGERFNSELRRHLVAFLEASGHRAVAPLLSPLWRTVDAPPAGLASTWSERHAAYAAGLGTFGLNDGLITPRGIAHRIGSIVTDRALPPTARPYDSPRAHCLFFQGAACGACIDRCPVGALSEEGHDKALCRDHVYGTVPDETSEAYGVSEAGCGLCQTEVPCESRSPKARGRPLELR